MRYWRIGLVVALLWALAGCQLTPRSYEQLLPQLPSERIKDWPMKYHEQGVYVVQIWQHPQQKQQNALLISRYVGVERALSGFRTLQDVPGQQKCDQFTSTTLPYQYSDAALPALFWVTDCRHDNGAHSQILQLAVQGKYALYHVQRIWGHAPSTQALTYWKQVLNNMVLCAENDEQCVRAHKDQPYPAKQTDAAGAASE